MPLTLAPLFFFGFSFIFIIDILVFVLEGTFFCDFLYFVLVSPDGIAELSGSTIMFGLLEFSFGEDTMDLIYIS